MRRDYKDYYKKYFSKNIFPDDWDIFKIDLYLDHPDDKVISLFNYIKNDEIIPVDAILTYPDIPCGYNNIQASKIESVCVLYAQYEWWARIIDAIIDWAERIDHGNIFRDTRDFTDSEITVFVTRSEEILKKYTDFKAYAFVRTFNYYHNQIEPERFIDSLSSNIDEALTKVDNYLPPIASNNFQPTNAIHEPSGRNHKMKILSNHAILDMFDKACESGLMSKSSNESYSWNETYVLLAYFAEKLSNKFNLGKGCYTKDNETVKKTSWIGFETVFGLKSGVLKRARADYMKTNTIFYPDGADKVDDLF